MPSEELLFDRKIIPNINVKKKILLIFSSLEELNTNKNLIISAVDYHFDVYILEQLNIVSVAKLDFLLEVNNVTILQYSPVELIYNLPGYGLCLSTCFYFSHKNYYPLVLASALQELKIPLLALQHSYFQDGLNFYYSDIKLGMTAIYNNISTETILRWEGDSEYSIGYPVNYKNTTNKIQGSYILVLCDLSIDAYSNEEKALFYTIIKDLSYELPTEQIVIRLLDKSNHINDAWLSDNMLLNVTMSPSSDQITTDYLIEYSKFVIHTLSTDIISSEILKKSAILYKTPSTSSVIQTIKKITTFEDKNELIYHLKHFLDNNTKFLIETNVVPFSRNKFLNILDKYYNKEKTPLPLSKINSVLIDTISKVIQNHNTLEQLLQKSNNIEQKLLQNAKNIEQLLQNAKNIEHLKILNSSVQPIITNNVVNHKLNKKINFLNSSKIKVFRKVSQNAQKYLINTATRTSVTKKIKYIFLLNIMYVINKILDI